MPFEPKKQSLLGTVLIAIIVGGGFGILELWILELSWKGFLGAVATGISFFLVIAIIVHLFGEQRGIRLALLACSSGGLAGVVWQYVTDSAVQPALAGCAGATLALFMSWLEGGFKSEPK